MRRTLFAMALMALAVGCNERPEHRRLDVIGAPAKNVGSESETDLSSLGPQRIQDLDRDRKMENAKQKFTELGTVQQSADDSITISRPNGQPLELTVQSLTSISMDGRPLTPRGVPEGAEVRASYVVSGKQKLAEHIEVIRPQPVGASKPKARRGR